MSKSKEKTDSQFYLDMSKRIRSSAIALSISVSAAFFFVLGFLLDFSFDNGYRSYENYSLIFGFIFGPITIVSLIVFFVFYLSSISKFGQLKLVVNNYKNYKKIIFITHSVGLFFILISTFFSVFDVRYSEFILTRFLAFFGFSLFISGILYLVKVYTEANNKYNQKQIKNADKLLRLGSLGILFVLLSDTIIRRILENVNSSIYCTEYVCGKRLEVGYFNQIFVLNYIILVFFFLFLILFLLGLYKVSINFKKLATDESSTKIQLTKLSLKEKISAISNSINITFLISAVLTACLYLYIKVLPISFYTMDEAFMLFFVYGIVTIIVSLASIFLFIKLFVKIKDLNESEDKTYKMRTLTFLLKSLAIILFFIGLVFDFIAVGYIEFYFFFGNILMIISILLLILSFIQDLRIYRLFNEKTKIKPKEIFTNPIVIFLILLLVFIIATAVTQLLIGLQYSTLSYSSYSGEPRRFYELIYWNYFNILVIVKISISIVFMIVFPFALNSLRNSMLRYVDEKKQTKKAKLELTSVKEIKILNLIFLIGSSISFLFISVYYIVSISADYYWITERMFSFIIIGSIMLLISVISYSKYIKFLKRVSESLNLNEKRRKLSYNLILYSGIIFFSTLIFNFLENSIEIQDYIIVGILILCSLSVHFAGYTILYRELKTELKVGNKEKISFFALLSSIPVFLTSFLIRIISDKYDWNAFDDDALWIIIVELILFVTVLILFLIGKYKMTKSISGFLTKQSEQEK
ncbi:MAG: hypothetical protein KGD64_10405 [Candidatus Heimdallarchaeota archaeon]|nr:hypothetical protein [Candidatus Heimdallarchaeota archaeon]